MGVSISRDEWLKALGESAAPPDPDALTIMELAREFGIGRQTAYRRIQDLEQAGRIQRTFKVVTTAGGRKRVAAYKLITPPAKAKRR